LLTVVGNTTPIATNVTLNRLNAAHYADNKGKGVKPEVGPADFAP